MSMTTTMKHLCVALAFVMALECCGVLGRLDWVKVVKRPACKRFDVTVYIDCDKPLILYRPSNSQFSMLCRYCREGIKRYWSRGISYAGSTWKVNVNTVLRSRGDRKKIKLQWRKSSSRSHNSDILKMTVKYLSKRSDAAALFKETCAHEIGHSFLRDAHGIKYSWGHKGTSSIFGGRKSSAPSYPSSGEIDLMKYYKGSASNFYSRVVAAESDVEDLVFKVRDSYTTNSGKC
ncbi:uncharacterized protein LOC106163439 [Lingula anatina]|uniref:Uncharacterized protein LOC106163439 n=1 Tax=Lingula anatina TaxID=7574 RepID=A0A1S3IF44_LINAN|nr:uncharacterized protein LOC106163439 [Lingula anatina]|eukprot:XP_013396476.1 uncharacterized protein LOC106163439 [Lingula anatina]